VYQNLATGGFSGPLYAVNPKGGVLSGWPIFPSIAALPETPDLAVIVTPPDSVPDVVGQLGQRGCRAGIVITAGFGEGGAVEGARRRDALLTAAQPHLFRIIGPNCLGVMVPSIGLNASFARTGALPGKLALVAQSGAIASALLDWARPRGLGFSHVVTVGDMCDVDFGDMLDYLGADDSTQAILLYVEALTNARKFMSAARRTARLKPVLVLKGGRQAEGAKVATSHTGALAGSDAIYDAVFARAGILRVDDLDDLFLSAECLALIKAPTGGRLGIVTNGGGLGVLAADHLLAGHGQLAQLSPGTLTGLSAALPPTWSHANPVDIIGDADAHRYAEATKAVLADSGVDAVVVMLCPTSAADPDTIADAIADVARHSSQKPLLAAWTGETSVQQARRILEAAGIATFATPREAVSGFLQGVRYRKLQDLLLETPPRVEDIKPHVVQDTQALIDQVVEEAWLPATEVKHILNLYGIPCNRTAVASSAADAQRLAQSWGGRVVLKINSPDIVHKSDVGGVLLDVDPDGVERETLRMIEAVRKQRPEARLNGVIVEEMIKRPSAHEVFIGMTTDPTFGPVLAVGHGGTGIEVINDKAFGLPPLNLTLARAMIESTRMGKLLAGYRNCPPANITSLATALVNLSQLVADHPGIVDLDINPLLVDADGIIAVDARIKVSPGAAANRMIISPYPRHLACTLTRPERPPFHVRPVAPQDAPLIEEFVRCLSRDDRRSRFFVSLRKLDHSTAARLSQLDYDREMALIATPTATSRDAMAIARFHSDPDNMEAEFAVAVRTDLKAQGVGYALMRYLIDVASARGIQRLWGMILDDNVAMLALAQALGMRLEHSKIDNTVRAYIDLADETSVARHQELMKINPSPACAGRK
jgi:acetyltransferase